MRAGHIRNILLWGDGHIYSRTTYADMRCNLRITFGVVPVPVNYNSSGIVGPNRHSKIDFIVNFRIIYVVIYNIAISPLYWALQLASKPAYAGSPESVRL